MKSLHRRFVGSLSRLLAVFAVLTCAAVAPAVADDVEKGFTPLHNGQDTSGWEAGVHATEEGYVDGGGRYVAKQFGDFVLRFDFRLKVGANSGIGVRAARTGDAAYHGMEIQVLENTAPQYKNLKPYQFHGSIYGVVAAKRGFLKPVGEWNTEEIVADGDRIKVTLNGTVIVDADIREASKDGTIDGRNHPGLLSKEGYLAICGHGGGVQFRNMRIKELK